MPTITLRPLTTQHIEYKKKLEKLIIHSIVDSINNLSNTNYLSCTVKGSNGPKHLFYF